jgi:DNA-binding PadR family transcriptional regulator
MSIKFAILGFLSWSPMTGYELKKLFANSTTLHWSGNNNQIYKALVDLHRHDLVTLEVQYQESHPPRKIYTITDAGRSELRQWVLSTPEPPQLRNTFLVQLAWADQLSDDELDALIAAYEAEVTAQRAMAATEQQRTRRWPQRTPREAYLWQMIAENQIAFYDSELDWIRRLRRELSTL